MKPLLRASPAELAVRPVPDPATEGLAQLVRAVGSVGFGEHLLGFWQQHVGAVDQLVAFTQMPERPGEALFTVGRMPLRLAQSLTQRYLDAYHLMDPTTDEVGVLEEDGARLTRMNLDVPASSVYKSFFFEHSRLVDRVAIVTRWRDMVVACHGYRQAPSAPFHATDLASQQRWLGTLAALLRQHVALGSTHSQPRLPATQPLLRRQALLERLSPREKAVFQRLLAGLSVDAIALDLGVSANTIRTFRKKLYRKLEVTSRFELYHKYLHHQASADDSDPG